MVILRHPARAVRIAAALRAAELHPYALPLTDTELPADTGVLARELGVLGRGGHDWLVVTSANAVRALEVVAQQQGLVLAEVVRAGGVRIAAVGAATAHRLAEAGMSATLLPDRASSSGLLEVFPPGPGAVLLPQADLAPEDLHVGLTRLGWTVRRIEAYRTVAFPADSTRALPVVADDGPQPELLAPGDVLPLSRAGVHPAVVFLAPSAVVEFRAKLGSALRFLPIAIGPTTAAALRTAGWEPAATATDPTPDGIARAVVEAVSRPPTFEPESGTSNGDQS